MSGSGKSSGSKSPKSAHSPASPKNISRAPSGNRRAGPCPHLCCQIPTTVPAPEKTQHVLHPRKDVFVFKVAKIGPNGDRRCKVELELVTPKAPEKKPPGRVDTREAQCEPEPAPCCCVNPSRKQRKK